MNYYEALGVSRNSEPEVIDAAYRALMKKYHPDLWKGDKAEAEPRARLINEAYATLRDEQRRRAYDRLHPADRPRIVKPPSMSAHRGANGWGRQPIRAGSSYRRHGAPIARATSKHPLADNRALMTIICASLVLLAVIALVSQGTSRTHSVSNAMFGVHPVAAPAQGRGRQRAFCITNKTANLVEYTLYWGGTTARRFAVQPGYYVMHSSAYSGAPLVKFFNKDGAKPAINVVKPVPTSGNPEVCKPNYSFMPGTELASAGADGQFGLYRDGPR